MIEYIMFLANFVLDQPHKRSVYFDEAVHQRCYMLTFGCAPLALILDWVCCDSEGKKRNNNIF